MGQQLHPSGGRQVIQFGSQIRMKLHVPGHQQEMLSGAYAVKSISMVTLRSAARCEAASLRGGDP
jgi:hypothetical protein